MQPGKSEAFLGLSGEIYDLSRVACLVSEQIAPRKIHKIVLCPVFCFSVLYHWSWLSDSLSQSWPIATLYHLLSSHTLVLPYPEYTVGLGSSCYIRLFPIIIIVQGLSTALEFKYKLQNLPFKVRFLPVPSFLLQVMRKLCAVSQWLLLPHHLPCQASCSCFHTFAWAIHDHSSLLPLLLTYWWFNSPIGVFAVCSSITSPPHGLSSSIRLDEASSWHGGLRFQKNGEIESTLSPKAYPQVTVSYLLHSFYQANLNFSRKKNRFCLNEGQGETKSHPKVHKIPNHIPHLQTPGYYYFTISRFPPE